MGLGYDSTPHEETAVRQRYLVNYSMINPYVINPYNHGRRATRNDATCKF